MTGAGIGGCTVSLVQTGCVEEFQYSVKRRYQKKTGLESWFYVANSADGAKEVQL